MCQTLLGLGDGEPVYLVEDHHGDLVVTGESAQVLIVHEGIGVFLRVEHPHHEVDPLHEPIHVGAVLGMGGVVVGQVDEDEVREGFAAPVHHVPTGDSQPLQQGDCLRGLLPDGCQRFARGGTQHPGLGHLGTDDRVEQGGFSGACGTRECHDREAVRQTAPGAGARSDLAGGIDRRTWQAASGDVRRLGQTCEPPIQLGAVHLLRDRTSPRIEPGEKVLHHLAVPPITK